MSLPTRRAASPVAPIGWKAREWSSAARAMRRTMAAEGEGESDGENLLFPQTNLNEKEERLLGRL